MRFPAAVAALFLCGSVVAKDLTAIKHVVSKPLNRAPRAVSHGGLRARQTDTCFSGGSCADCFGDGYIECSSDSSMCYDPATQDEDFACSSSSSPEPSPSSFPSGEDTCFSGGSCADCFGDGYIECSNDDTYCYDPSFQDEDIACSSGSGSSGSPDSSSTPTATFGGSSPTNSFGPSATPSSETCYTGGSCEDCFGDGYTECPDSDSDCYNPDQGPSSKFCPPPTSTGAAVRLADGHNSLLATVLGAVGLMAAM